VKKSGTTVAVRKGIPHIHVYLPPLVSVEAIGVCIPMVMVKYCLQMFINLQTEPGVMPELLSFRRKSILAGGLNAKNLFWNSIISNNSGMKLFNLQHINVFSNFSTTISSHYSPTGNGDVLDIAVYKNFRLSEVIVSEILDSDHLSVIFHLLGHIRSRKLSNPVDKFTDWERFQSLASEFISPKIQINSEGEADKSDRHFTASIASA
jgi:hypothetical protein